MRTLADIKAELIHTYISKYANLFTHDQILQMVNTAALDIYNSQVPVKETRQTLDQLLLQE